VQLDDGRLIQTLAGAPKAPAAGGPGVRCGVCLTLFARPATTILGIVKADHTGEYPWGGHVALPGGRVKASDASAQATALRELHEEVGIAAWDVTLLGELGHFQTVSSGHDLHVTVCRWRRRCPLQLDPREVAQILELDLGRVVELQRLSPPGGDRPEGAAPPPDFEWDGLPVWGVTARILRGFCTLVLDGGCAVA